MKPKTHFLLLNLTTIARGFLAMVLLGLGLASMLTPIASASDFGRTIASNDAAILTSDAGQTVLNVPGTRLRATDSNQKIHLAVALHSQDEAGLTSFLADLYSPNSPIFHQYLTPVGFDARFGPTKSVRSQLVSFLQSQGLQVSDSGTGMLVNADGTVAQVQAAFNVTISDYQDVQGRVFYATDRTPTLPAALSGQVRAVAGLSNRAQLQAHSARNTTPNISPRTGTPLPADCSGAKGQTAQGAYVPDQLATAYDISPFYSAGFSGTGQIVALYELADYANSDISTFQNCFPYLTNSIPITRVLVDGGPTAQNTTGGISEVELDMQIILGLVPNLGGMLVYEAPNTGNNANYLDNFQKIATDNLAQVVSDSWGDCELNTDADLYNGEFAILQQMAAQGISVFAASGDNGVLDCRGDLANATARSVDDPASQPFVTGVGGTNLQVTITNSYSSETVWNNFSGASGGGVSTFWQKPAWQVGTGVNNNVNRQVPDVAADGDPQTGYVTYIQGGWTTLGGTSGGAPLWAAQTLLTNQYLVANGKPRLGYANPSLYQVFNAPGLLYPPYHDITVGTNGQGSDSGYAATPGYDRATGIGSFDGWNIARDLKTLGAPPPTLYVTPSQLNPFVAQVGGTNPNSQTLSIGIIGNGALNWNATTTTNSGGNWLTVSPINGTVRSSGPLTQTATVSVNIAGLTAGTYTGNVLVGSTDITQTISIPVTLTLSSVPPPPPPVYTYYLPFLAQNAGGFTTYLAIQNIGVTTTNISIQYFNNTGFNFTNGSTTLAALAEYLPSQVFSDSATGGGIITSGQPLNVIVAEGTPYGGSAYAVGAGGSSNLIAPLAINNSGNFVTKLSVFNGGSVQMTATVRFYGRDGSEATQAARTLTIEPRTSSQLDQTQAGNGLPSGFYGWAQITGLAGATLVGQVLEQNPTNHFVAIANAQSTPQSTLYAPAIFNSAFGGFFTGENLVNPNATPVTVTITYHDANGSVPSLSGSQPTSRVLPPHAVLGLFDGGDTGLPFQFYGSATINAVGGGVVMVVNEIGPSIPGGGSESGTYPAVSTGSNNVYLPVIAHGGYGYTTGLTILNTSNQTLGGIIRYYKVDGTPQGTSQTFSVGPNASHPIFQGDPVINLPNDFYGTAVVSVTSGSATNALLVTTNAISSFTFYTYTEPTP